MSKIRDEFINGIKLILDRNEQMKVAGRKIAEAAALGDDTTVTVRADDMARTLALLMDYGEQTLAMRLTNQMLRNEINAGELHTELQKITYRWKDRILTISNGPARGMLVIRHDDGKTAAIAFLFPLLMLCGSSLLRWYNLNP